MNFFSYLNEAPCIFYVTDITLKLSFSIHPFSGSLGEICLTRPSNPNRVNRVVEWENKG